MANAQDFRSLMADMQRRDEEAIRYAWQSKEEEDEKYMADMSHWVCVHVTNFMPKRNKNGQLFMPTTAMATGNKLPRATIHVTLNQIVYSHMFGSWDAMPIVVVSPYNDIVKENGNPTAVASEDTYFTPNPDTGLVLPKETCIIKPDNGSLFHIGDKVATYKTEKFTDGEIETLLTYIDPYDQEQYKKLSEGVFQESEIPWLLGHNKNWIKAYESSNNKREFIAGLLEEDRYVILTRFLRNTITRQMMEKMGYKFVNSHEDNISGRVARVARDAGIPGDSGNKGHSFSIEKELEEDGVFLACLMDSFESLNIDEMYKELTRGKGSMCNLVYAAIQQPLIEGILSDTVPNIYGFYQNRFNNYMERQIDFTTYEIGNLIRYNKEYNESLDKLPELQEQLEHKKELQKGGISVYSPRLATAFKRHASRMTQKYVKTVEKLKQTPKYAVLKQRLDDFVNGRVLPNPNMFASSLLDMSNTKEYE